MTQRTYRATIGLRFGSAVARLRTLKGWSRPMLARRADLSETYMRLLEHGQCIPTLIVVVNLAEVLGVTPAELVRAATEPAPAEPSPAQPDPVP